MRTRGRGELLAGVALLAACASPPPPAPRRAPPSPVAAAPEPEIPHEIPLGPIVLTLSAARTAQVFHVVDRLARAQGRASALAQWADGAVPLDDAERAMLAGHAKLRARRGLGPLAAAFLVEDSISVAAKEAADKKILTAADAQAERALLEHFAPRLAPILEAQDAAIHAFELAIAKQAAAAAPLAAQLGRLCETEGTVDVQAFLVPDPSKAMGGEGFHGGRLVVEVLPGEDNAPTFFHHLFHAVIERRRGSIAIAAQKCDEPLDAETLQEGLAYAFAPGLVHEPGHDVLAEMVRADGGRPLSDPGVRFERLGLALRTELGSALEGGHESLGALLPAACDAWAKLVRP